MKHYIKHHEWHIVEEGFDPHLNRISESLFSLGNGRMGQRANFEEQYSGDRHQGSYVAGVYYPDKTRVGWWKNGYPEYFAKVRAEAENKLKEIPVMAKGVSASKGLDKRWLTVAAAVGGVLLLLVTLGKSRKK